MALCFGAVWAGVALVMFGIGTPGVRAGVGRSAAGQRCQRLVLVSARTGRILRRFPEFAIAPSHIAGLTFQGAVPDGRGGWFAFEYTETSNYQATKASIAHMRNDGTIDRRMPISLPSDSKYVLSRLGGKLYVGSRRGVEAYAAATGARLWRSPPMTILPVARANGTLIWTLAATPSRVYVGGEFSRVDGQPRQGVAALDARTGHLLPWRMKPPLSIPTGGQPWAAALAVTATRLYVGGAFDDVGKQRRPGIAAVSTKTGALLPWSPPPWSSDYGPGDVGMSIALAGRTVLIAGASSGPGAVDAVTGKRRPWANKMGDATTVSVAGSTAFLGGGPLTQTPVATINLTTGVRTNWKTRLGSLYVAIAGIVPSGGKALIEGRFGNVLC